MSIQTKRKEVVVSVRYSCDLLDTEEEIQESDIEFKFNDVFCVSKESYNRLPEGLRTVEVATLLAYCSKTFKIENLHKGIFLLVSNLHCSYGGVRLYGGSHDNPQTLFTCLADVRKWMAQFGPDYNFLIISDGKVVSWHHTVQKIEIKEGRHPNTRYLEG